MESDEWVCGSAALDLPHTIWLAGANSPHSMLLPSLSMAASAADGGLRNLRDELHRIDRLTEAIQSKLSADGESRAQRLLRCRPDVQCELSAMASGLAHIDALLDRPAQVGFSEPMDIDESAEELDASKSAVVPQAKRPCLERHSAPAAAGGGGVSSGPQEEGQANDQQQQQKQGVHRPCLDGIEGPLLCDGIASFLTTIEATVLCRLSKDLNAKADDVTSGIYRNLTIMAHDTKTWMRLNRTTPTRLRSKLTKIRRAHIEHSDGAFLSFAFSCIEASHSTITAIHISAHIDVSREPAEPAGIVFERLETMHISCDAWHKGSDGFVDHMSRRNWSFPSLCHLQVGSVSWAFSKLAHIMRSSPLLKTLTADEISPTGGERDWRDFTTAVGQCTRLTTIRGLRISQDKYCVGIGLDQLASLSEALNTNWCRQDMRGVQKTIGLDCGEATVSHSFADEARPLHTFLCWARGLGVGVEWRGFVFKLDCSKRVPSAPPAVHGPVADAVKELASQAGLVVIKCGGTSLHHTWRHLLSFPKADELSIEEDFDNPPIDRTIKSIPTWLLEVGQDGNNSAFHPSRPSAASLA
ncbi:unnamed protein product [Vitrella brassicaformis CCMP3155]|uniref:Uncharacterized protein n=1 Tax=Vitrella brassicaformis (strain CCMP3155) TaxID=1169540 RepID=A0A0G4FM22_VITBC|nr:unnamed protein product [Vitrella brassicaformis CCMP3155]|eukprot:CEM14563.1 unnamed protein product [Vitrella brassicaformis CCMP3155]